jgi:hypothetical protein
MRQRSYDRALLVRNREIVDDISRARLCCPRHPSGALFGLSSFASRYGQRLHRRVLARRRRSRPASRTSTYEPQTSYGIDVLAFGAHPDDVEILRRDPDVLGDPVIARASWTRRAAKWSRNDRRARARSRAAAKVMGLSLK